MDKYAEINLKNVIYNYDTFKRLSQKEVFPVLKANAYGHGDVEVAKVLEEVGVKLVCVSSIYEALRISEYTQLDILIFGYTETSIIKKYHKPQFIYTMGSLEWYHQAKEIPFQIRLHIKVNTGMNRFGFKRKEDISETLKTHHIIEGIYTHFSSSDESSEITQQQLVDFKNTLDYLSYSFKYVHASNTHGVDKSDYPFLNAIRVGLGIYGYCDCQLDLKPALNLYAEIKHIDFIKKGETIGYNGIDRLNKNSHFGMLQIGYADGIDPRNYGLDVYINTRPHRILGKICMDQMMIEVDPSVKIGDRVELIGKHRSLSDISKHTGIIKYQILTGLGPRIKRVYK